MASDSIMQNASTIVTANSAPPPPLHVLPNLRYIVQVPRVPCVWIRICCSRIRPLVDPVDLWDRDLIGMRMLI